MSATERAARLVQRARVRPDLDRYAHTPALNQELRRLLVAALVLDPLCFDAYVDLARLLGNNARTVWLADGREFGGTQLLAAALPLFPDNAQLFIEIGCSIMELPAYGPGDPREAP